MKDLQEWANRMVEINDSFANLPNECPEVAKSALFIEIMEQRVQLMSEIYDASEELERQNIPNKGLKFNN